MSLDKQGETRKFKHQGETAQKWQVPEPAGSQRAQYSVDDSNYVDCIGFQSTTSMGMHHTSLANMRRTPAWASAMLLPLCYRWPLLTLVLVDLRARSNPHVLIPICNIYTACSECLVVWEQ
jgi:hypothetical protein